MKRALCIILVVIAATTLQAREIKDFRILTDHISREELPDIHVEMRVEVVYAGKYAGGLYVVASADKVNYRGLLMSAPKGIRLKEGDVIDIEGGMQVVDGNIAIRADKIEKISTRALPEAPMHKFVDFRNGKLHARRAAFIGWIDPESVRIAQDGSYTTFHLTIWRSYMIVRVLGRLRISKYAGAPVKVTGIGYNYCDPETGEMKDVMFEVSSLDNVVSLREDKWKTPLLATASTVAAAAILALWFVWARARRERIANAAVAKDRRRLAAELHDTIEQHLATAKLYASGALRVPDLPPRAREALCRIADTLVHAKMEVRDAVMDLRDTRSLSRPLAAELRDMAKRISAGGAVMARVRMDDRDFAGINAAARRDITAIANEAVTNALKHGKAQNIAIVCDNGVLRILNDGEKFNPVNVLGPETGHFGLSGMRERAARSALALDFIVDEKWCGIRLALLNANPNSKRSNQKDYDKSSDNR